MNNASLELGGTNWAAKDGNLLGYAVGDLAGKYVPREFTFTRGSNLSATRVNENGLIEKGRENLLLQSNQFDTSPWVANAITKTGGQSGYDGSNNAWLLTSTFNYTAMTQNVSSSGVHTFSAYLKDDNIGLMQLRVNGSSFALIDIDLTAGVITGQAGTTIVDKGIEAVGNGWYRAYIVVNDSVSSAMIIFNDLAGKSFYIQNAQLEQGLAATDYIESGATTGKAGVLEDLPRLDYSDGTPSLLLEPSRTNRCTLSEYFEGVAWLSVGSPTITTNYGISPEGVKNSTRIQFSGTNQCIYDGIAYTSEEVSTIYVKGTSGETIKFGKGDNIFVGTLFTLDGTWQRLEFVQSVSGNTFTINTSGGATARDIEIWGAQNEEGSYPTSYIPNHSGGSVTRGVDLCGKTGVSSLIGQSEGTMYWEGYIDVSKSNYGYFPRLMSASSSSSNWIALLLTQTNQLRAQYVVGGSSDVQITHQISTSGNYKIAFAYNDNDFNCFVNGVSVGTNTSVATTIALNDVFIGMENGATLAPTSQETKQALLFDTRLSNADLAALTRPYDTYQEWVDGEGLTWESKSCTTQSILELQNL